MTLRVCRICGLEKELELFSKMRIDSQRTRCKMCTSQQVNDYIKQRRKTDPEYREKLRKISENYRRVSTPESRAKATANAKRRYAELRKNPEAHAAFLARVHKRRKEKLEEDKS